MTLLTSTGFLLHIFGSAGTASYMEGNKTGFYQPDGSFVVYKESTPTYINNPLSTDDKCTGHATLVACYQLAQSVLKIGFALA